MKDVKVVKRQKKHRHICEGDTVIAIAGDDKGKTGLVISRHGLDKVKVAGLNVCKKHVKRTQSQPGQIIDIEAAINVSNLKICTAEGLPVKLKVKKSSEGVRELYYTTTDGQTQQFVRLAKSTR